MDIYERRRADQGCFKVLAFSLSEQLFTENNVEKDDRPCQKLKLERKQTRKLFHIIVMFSLSSFPGIPAG